jgi:hypothetical protein
VWHRPQQPDKFKALPVEKIIIYFVPRLKLIFAEADEMGSEELLSLIFVVDALLVANYLETFNSKASFINRTSFGNLVKSTSQHELRAFLQY